MVVQSGTARTTVWGTSSVEDKNVEERFESLIAQMTREEKIAMLAGADQW